MGENTIVSQDLNKEIKFNLKDTGKIGPLVALAEYYNVTIEELPKKIKEVIEDYGFYVANELYSHTKGESINQSELSNVIAEEKKKLESSVAEQKDSNVTQEINMDSYFKELHSDLQQKINLDKSSSINEPSIYKKEALPYVNEDINNYPQLVPEAEKSGEPSQEIRPKTKIKVPENFKPMNQEFDDDTSIKVNNPWESAGDPVPPGVLFQEEKNQQVL